MVKHYPKIGRIPWGKTLVGKKYLTNEQVKELFDSDELIVEEKIDGKNMSITMLDDGRKYEVIVEHCKLKHSIPYDKLPTWNIILDIWDYDNEVFIPYMAKYKLCEKWGVNKMMAPLVAIAANPTIDRLVEMIGKSKFAQDQMAEGIVIKNYKKQLFGKLVRNEFITGIEDHWMLKSKEMNQLG